MIESFSMPFSVEEPDTLPTYQELKETIMKLENEKKAMNTELSNTRSKLQEKEGIIIHLETELRIKEEENEQIQNEVMLEIKALRRQMPLMREEVTSNKGGMGEFTKLISLKQDGSSLSDVCSGIQDLVDFDIMSGDNDWHKMDFLSKSCALLNRMSKYFPSLMRGHAALLVSLGEREFDDVKKMENRYNTALDIMKEIHGTNNSHKDTAWILQELAYKMYQDKSYKSAVEYFTQSLEMYKELAHPYGVSQEVAQTYYWLGMCWTEMSRNFWAGGCMTDIGGCKQQAVDNFNLALEVFTRTPQDWFSKQCKLECAQNLQNLI